MAASPIDTLLQSEPRVINLGLAEFARDLAQRGVSAVQVEWSPPVGGDPELLALLEKLGG